MNMSAQLGVGYAYRCIVFGLPNRKHIDNALEIKKCLSFRSVIISEHEPGPEDDCEYEGLHYHGLVENVEGYRFDTDRMFEKIKERCAFFKSEVCKKPVNFLAYMQIPPRHIILHHERNSESDLSLLRSQVTDSLIDDVKKRKIERVNEKHKGAQDIMTLKDMIARSGCQSENELLTAYNNNEEFTKIFCKQTFTRNFKKALAFAVMEVLETPYLDLCANWEDTQKVCYDPEQSADIVANWCKFQNIQPYQFAMSIKLLMDKMRRKKNTIIMHGEPNSGKTYIAKSVEKAAIFYGEVNQGTAGYQFAWQDCVQKRLIIINEPFFDHTSVEKLKVILECTGTYVDVKSKHGEFLRPTPVIITTNNPIWNQAPQSKDAIEARCLAIYDNLRSCPLLKNVTKDLHPNWINVLLIRLARETDTMSKYQIECHTSQDTGTVDRGLTLPSQTEKEDQSTSSTTAAARTTSPSPTPFIVRDLLTKPLLNAPRKKDSLEEASLQQSKRKRYYDLYSETGSPELKSCPPVKRRSLQTKDLSNQITLSPKKPILKEQLSCFVEDSPLTKEPTHRVDQVEIRGEEPWKSYKKRLAFQEEEQWELDKSHPCPSSPCTMVR